MQLRSVYESQRVVHPEQLPVLIMNMNINRVPTHLESQAESGKVRELIWSGKVSEFCWWSGNYGSLQTKTAIFVYVSGQSSYSLM